MSALKALLLSDGKPGHFRLAEGVLAAISRRRDVAITRLDVDRRRIVPARVVSGLVNAGLSPAAILRIVYGVDAGALPASDVVVSAGGNTLGANVAAARYLGASNIFYGSLRRFLASDFSLVLTSYAKQVIAPNQLCTLKPSAIDPDSLGQIGFDGAGMPIVAGLILGGDSGTVRFVDDDWQRLFSFMDGCFEQSGTRWIVSNSARTPDAVSNALAARMIGGADRGAVQSFIDVRDPGAAPLEALFERAQVVLCTADSSTMLSECVWARKRVVAVAPAGFALPDNERAYRDWLSAQGWVNEMAISDLSADLFLSAMRDLAPLEENPLDRLADELRQRLPELF